MNKGLGCAVAGILLLAAFAGCIDDDLEEDPDTGKDAVVQEDRQSHDLFGWVVDPSFDPIEQVNMSVIGVPDAADDTTTNETGFFSFPKLPRGEELTLIAKHEKFLTRSKQLLLPTDGSMRLNFTLEPAPDKTPWSTVLEFEGLIACQAVIEYEEAHRATSLGAATAALSGPTGPAGTATASNEDEDEDRIVVDCGGMDPNNADSWEFSVGADLAGVVVEVSWEENTPYSEFFRLTLETDGHGGDNSTLAQVVGGHILSAQVNNHQAQKFYQDGGKIRATVEVDPNVADEETGTGVAFAYQQEFTIHATAFYVDSPPATYSFHSE